MTSEEIGKKIISVSFNQTNVKFIQNLLAISTIKGFRIIRLEDGKIISKKDEESSMVFQGGFSHLALVFSTSLICFVGSSANARYPPNIVIKT